MKLCGQCCTPTPLPYFCRPCWAALGPAAQQRFYAFYGAGNGQLHWAYARAQRGMVR